MRLFGRACLFWEKRCGEDRNQIWTLEHENHGKDNLHQAADLHLLTLQFIIDVQYCSSVNERTSWTFIVLNYRRYPSQLLFQ